tara:strand:+ start:1345 stop:2004 length:660 start_codon:yes stop_codon:yes gene_type:complete
MKSNLFFTLSLIMFIAGCMKQYPNLSPSVEKKVNNVSKIAIIKKTDRGIFQAKEDFFITCLTKELREKNFIIISDKEFRDHTFPFFESDEATVNVEPSIDILQNKLLQKKMNALGVDYIIWVSGRIDYSDKVGAMSCTLGLYGGGCYGYTSQKDQSNIQAEIWHVARKKLLSYNTAAASGKSHLFAFILPIPIPSDSQQSSCKELSRSVLIEIFKNLSG